MNVLSPIAAGPAGMKRLARRPVSLRGCRLGVLDDSKPNADALLGRVAEMLAARAGVGTIRRWTKPGSSRVAINLDEIAAVADVVLTGSAD